MYLINIEMISMCFLMIIRDVYSSITDNNDININLPDQNYPPSSSNFAGKPDVYEQFLSEVEKVEKDKCTPGTEYNLGDGVVAQYGLTRFKKPAMVAVQKANFLTKLYKGGAEDVMKSEYFLYTSVRDMIESDPDIFSAGHCHDKGEYKNYSLFCPFGVRLPDTNESSGGIIVKDLAMEYDYLTNNDEFFYQPRLLAEKKLKGSYEIVKGYALYRYNNTHYSDEVEEDNIKVVFEDGHWTKPYYDCGGGNIWMMTYIVAFFGFKNNKYYFKGTSGIDIDLRKVDINQCDESDNDEGLNVFRGSNKCKKDNTKCVPVYGLGFRRGSYRCECRKGYYFPYSNVPLNNRFFNGSEIEMEYEKNSQRLPSRYDTGFSCFKCAPGCDICIDDRPCILTLHWVQRDILLSLSIIITFFIPVLLWFTLRYAEVKVMKAASPVLLRIILLGAVLLYSPLLINYPEPTVFRCTLRFWMREIGFSIMYGALLLKTWRISVVFRVRSARAIKISDTDLIKRLLIIVSLFTVFLAIRTIFGRTSVIKGKHSKGLYTFQCSWDKWDYLAAIAELFLLLWGIRLCIVVRKAPSEFNESRFISWAIYNETLLSLFLNIIMFFLQSFADPDLLYLVLFIYSQITTTITLAFLFGSKAYLVYKYSGKEQPPHTISRGSKYAAAPNETLSNIAVTAISSNSPSLSTREKHSDEGNEQNGTIEKDVQEEFRRLYIQLEILKQKNMKLGNPHLSQKLSAMTEAAKLDSHLDSVSASPNLNGKRIVINLEDYDQGTSL